MNFETSMPRNAERIDYVAEEETARSKRPIYWLAAIIVILALAIGYYFLKTPAPKIETAKQLPSVTVVIPGRETIANIVTSTGTLAARREMPVGVAGEGGVVSRVWVDAGDWVAEGQILASVDRAVQAQESNQLSAGIAAAQADARLAQSELDRARALVDRGFISKADIDRKSAARDSAQARVSVAVAQLGAAKARMRRLDIRSPAAGYVLSRSVETGQVVSAGAGALFRIARGGEMEMHAQLSEADLAKMSVGLNATVTPVGTASGFNGQIWQLSPTIDPQTRQGIARIALPYNVALRPGGFASANITSGVADAPLLPESAVQSDARGNYVYIISGANKAERRDIKVGSVTNNGVTILSGLSGQEQVILSAGAFLNAGETVKPVRQTLQK